MTREEALNTLMKMRAWREWGKGEQNKKDMPEMPEPKEVDEAFDVFIETLSQPSLPSNLDEAAEEYSENILANNEDLQDAIEDAFKSGAEWREQQMRMPDSTKLLSEWKEVKSILKEKDFRGDAWRLAYHAFLFGFSRGYNTKKSDE